MLNVASGFCQELDKKYFHPPLLICSNCIFTYSLDPPPFFQMKRASASLSFSSKVFQGECCLYHCQSTLLLVLRFGSVPLDFNCHHRAAEKMSLRICPYLDPSSPEEADQHPGRVAWRVLSVFSSCNRWPRQQVSIQTS